MKQISTKGYSLIEILVVLAVFAIIAIITTQTLAQSLRSSRKSDAQSRARQNVDYAMSTMERLLRNSQTIECLQNGRMLKYTDGNGNTNARLACCPFDSQSGYVASGFSNADSCAGLSRLTSNEVNIDCRVTTPKQFECTTPADQVPPSVMINITGIDASTSGAEGNQVTSRSKILLRTYDK